MEPVRAEREFRGAPIEAHARWVGEDLWVTLAGGTRPHIGSLILASPRPSLRDPSQTSATSSVLNRPGHLDERPGRALAERLAAALDRHVALACGIHYDGLDAPAVARVEELCAGLGEELLARLRGGGPAAG
ncbi:MAG: hypothetical protein AABZ64_10090 [Nitrospinota bacterium]